MLDRPEQTRFAMQSLPMPRSGQNFLLAAATLQGHAFMAIMRYQIETLAFLQRRCEDDSKLVDDLIGGAEFNDAFDVVGNFLQNTMAGYVNEAGRMASINARLAVDAAGFIQKEAQSTIENMAARTIA